MNSKFAGILMAILACTTAAQAQLVVIGHPSATALNAEQVTDLYLGRNQSGSLIDLPEANPLRSEFYKKATGKEPGQVKALWARLAFTGKAQPPREQPDAAAVKKVVAADPKAVGYIDKSAVDGTVKVLLGLN